MGIAHLDRLRHIRGLLTAQGRPGAATARLLCFSGAGFTAELRDEAARSGEARLLTPADLYTGILLQHHREIEYPRTGECFARPADGSDPLPAPGSRFGVLSDLAPGRCGILAW